MNARLEKQRQRRAPKVKVSEEDEYEDGPVVEQQEDLQGNTVIVLNDRM